MSKTDNFRSLTQKATHLLVASCGFPGSNPLAQISKEMAALNKTPGWQ
jgi:hypothetical protein